MIRRRPIVLKLLPIVFFASISPAVATIDGIGLAPLTPAWELENPKPRGDVTMVAESLWTPREPTGELASSFKHEYHFTYDDAGRLKLRTETRRNEAKPVGTELFDRWGHCILFTATAADGPKTVPISNAAIYDARGQLLRYEISSGGPVFKVLVRTILNPLGYTYMWAAAAPHQNGTGNCAAKYDAAQRLIETRVDIDGFLQPRFDRLTYNDNGDVSSTKNFVGPIQSPYFYQYEYEYDARHNWTRQTIYRVESKHDHDVKQVWRQYNREVIYADGTHSTSKTAPSVAGLNIPPRTVSAGAFTATMGDPGKPDAFVSIMSLVLKRDSSFTLNETTSDRTAAGGKRVNHTLGRWTQDDGVVTLTMTTRNGVFIAANNPHNVMKLTADDDTADRLVADSGAVFTKNGK